MGTLVANLKADIFLLNCATVLLIIKGDFKTP